MEAGVGDGRHAFSWPLSASLLAGGEQAVVARERGTGEALEGSPLALPSAPAAGVSASPRAASESTALREPVHDDPAAVALAPENTRTHPDGWADRLADEAVASVDAEAAVPHAPILSVGDSSIAQPADRPEPVPELQGCFEAIVKGQATGWVLDPLRPEDRIEVELLCDGEVIARAHADLELVKAEAQLDLVKDLLLREQTL